MRLYLMAGTAACLCALASSSLTSKEGSSGNDTSECFYSLPTPGQSLCVTVILDKKSYGADDRIEVSVVIKNVSQKLLYLYAPVEWGEKASVGIWLKDAAGQSVGYYTMPEAMTAPPESKDDFVAIPPDHFLGRSWRIPVRQLNVKTTGFFRIHAVYHSPVRSDSTFDLPTWTRENGSVRSKDVSFEIVK